MTSLIDDLLAEQRNLTAVERFARWHEKQPAGEGVSSHRALIPLTKPRPGEQYAFEVDLDRCSGCKSCVTACHALNGLDEDETWRSVGVLHGQSNKSFQQTITTACHHCADPACATGCPVLAYDKDPATGIVRHLDDQCIGCEYCVLMCPYEVPKYSEKRGIVRKCDMCHQRLAQGEAPACAQACPSHAIRITIVSNTQTATLSFSGAPDPAITRPTTKYVSQQPLPSDAVSLDANEVKPQAAHLPLVWMLVLTQMGAGGFAILPLVAAAFRPELAGIALGATALGLGISILHLGKPLKAWRVFLGLRRSWLSREILVFGAFAALASAQTIFDLGVSWLTSAVGLVGVCCSAMTYHVTRREVWRGERSMGRFALTTAILGLASAWAAGEPSFMTRVLLVFGMTIKLSRELAFLAACQPEADWYEEVPDSFVGRSAHLLRFRFGQRFRTRIALGCAGGIVLPLISLVPGGGLPHLAGFAVILCLCGEWLERSLFFRTAVVPRMPGGN